MTSITTKNNNSGVGGGNKRDQFKNNTKTQFDPNSIKQLPTSSDELKNKHYFGEYIGFGIKVLDFEQGLDLYKHGCFGKGVLSRSAPIFDNLKNTITGSGFHIKKKDRSNNITTTTHKRIRVEIDNNNNTNNTSNENIEKEKEEKRVSKQQKLENDNDNNNKNEINENTIKTLGSSKIENEERIEYVQLSLGEAFYLMYGLGCLTILRDLKSTDKIVNNLSGDTNEIDKNKKTMVRMTIEECWNEFQSVENGFVEKYIAYHYFRSLGWIPRSGLKYGCDFILYKLKPDLIHAQYGIIIQNREFDGNNDNGGREIQSWEELSGINRVSESVAKGIIIVNIFKPKLFSASTIDLLKISEYKLNLWEIKRWVPNKTRNT